MSVVADFAPDDDLRGLEAAGEDAVDIVVWDIVVWDVEVGDADLELDSGSFGALTVPVLALVPEGADLPALFSGVGGVLYRTASAAKLAAALGALARGLSVLEPALAEALSPQPSTAEPLLEDLTPRETEVLQHLAAGRSNKAVAKALDISENTVKFHVNALFGKFGVTSRTEIVVRAIQLGLITV